jgi:hypothetical protein
MPPENRAEYLADLKRYADLIASQLRPPFTFAAGAESATAVQVERGIVYPAALLDPASLDISPTDRLVELATSDRLASLAVVDRAGHHRPAYGSVLVYAWLQAFRLAYETLPRAQFGRWEEGLRPWCDMLEGELTSIELPGTGAGTGAATGTGTPASRGASATEAAWTALALFVAGKVFIRDAWTDLASDTFGRLTRAQQPSGAFLLASASDNPETTWYHELVILHAAGSYAVQAEDRTVAAAVKRASDFHLAETQPDHATSQPWAIFPFVWNPRTRPLADALLHAHAVHNPQQQQASLSLMLLADALYCLRLFVK